MKQSTVLGLGGVLLFATALVSCGGMGSTYNPAAPTTTATSTPTPGAVVADVTITIVGMSGNLSYSPDPATLKVGQAVAWRNADSVVHTATADGGAFNTGNIAPGATSSAVTMTTAGSFPYHCLIHGFTMVGTLTVTP